jgi:hypothetical protein
MVNLLVIIGGYQLMAIGSCSIGDYWWLLD